MTIYAPGTRIGQYEIAGRPLMGGMGIVYVCNDLEQDHPVALKTFKPEYLPDRAARDRFLREGTAWVDLGIHPHIVRCYRVFQPENAIEVYLVLELVAKEQGRDDASLRAWLTPGQPLPVETALLFALQIARGMQHAVKRIPGFVHRDLKPENVLVGADRLPGTTPSQTGVNRLRVTDFGLATVLQEASGRLGELATGDEQETVGDVVGRTRLTRGIAGTPLYMAPEQWRGEQVTVATDVYALGCMLYEMVTGHRAAAGRSLAALERVHCDGKRPALPEEVPEVVQALVGRWMAVEPGIRCESWEKADGMLTAAYMEVSGHEVPEASAGAMLNHEGRVAVGWSYNAIGISYADIGKAEVALGYFERAVGVGEGGGERALESAAQGNLGGAHLHMGNARRAIDNYRKQLPIAREIGDRGGEGDALSGLGLAYAALGEVRRAIGYHEQALAIAGGIGDRHREGDTLGNLGLAYAALGDVRTASRYHEQALEIHREIGDRRGEGNALGNLGNTYLQSGDAQRAIGYFEQQFEITRGIGDRRGEGSALGSLANAYLQSGEARRAIDYYKQRLEIAREIGDMTGTAAGSFNMAVLCTQQGDALRALELAQEAARIYTQIGHAEHAQRAQELIDQIQGGSCVVTGLSSAQILQQFGQMIEAVVAAAGGHAEARAAVEGAFDSLEQNGWSIAEPIRRIWAGERDKAALTAGIDANSALVVREIMKQLSEAD